MLHPLTRQLLREHRRHERCGYRIPYQDNPAKTPRSTEQLLARCGQIGTHLGVLAEQTYRRDGPESIRRILVCCI